LRSIHLDRPLSRRRVFATNIKFRLTPEAYVQFTPIFIVRIIVLRNAVIFPKRFRQCIVYAAPGNGALLIAFPCDVYCNSSKKFRQFVMANKARPVDLDAGENSGAV
jgi:hypothetical protein